MSEREKRTGTVPAASASTERKEVVVARKTAGGRQAKMNFKFDEVLGSFSSQEDVFSATLQPLVPQVLAGYEATAFAYGQTGTGKTYTMEGQPGSEEARGLMPRAAAAVLDALAKGKYLEFHVAVSYLEIYNEELTDLLAPVQNQPKLDLLEAGGHRGVCCVGLSEVPVSSLDDINRLVSAAQERRRVAETRINARSSRSHCIFTMKVLSRRMCPGGEQETVGKLHLVDLAGSECAKKAALAAGEEPSASPTLTPRPTQNQAASCALEQERERRNINQSLLTLRRVINALREKTGRVPYRDSKLTRLLQSALGGSCKTVVIATISPALAVVEETISTLTYAEQAAGIQNRPVAMSSLRAQGAGSSFCDGFGDLTPAAAGEWSADLEMKLAYLSQEVEEAQAALARKDKELQEVSERAEHAEQENVELKAQLERALETAARETAEKQRVMAAAGALAEDLAGASRPVASIREEVSCKSAQLGRQDATAAEQRMVALLLAQRESLQAELAEVRGALDSSRAEVAAARREASEGSAAQAKGRAAALERIMELARTEMETLGKELVASEEGVSSRLQQVEALHDRAGDSTTGAERRGVAAGQDVVLAAEQWRREVEEGCDALGRAAEEAASEAERGIAAVAEQLRTLSGEAPLQAASTEHVVFEDVRQEARTPPAQEWDPQRAKENVSLAAKAAEHVAAAAAAATTAVPAAAAAAAAVAGGGAVAVGKVKAVGKPVASAAPRGPLREVN